MDTPTEKIDEFNLPFNLQAVSTEILPLDNLKLWVIDVSNESIGNNKDLKVIKQKALSTTKQYQYRIANWNVERPQKLNQKSNLAIETINELNADVIVLTETSNVIQLNNYKYISKTKEYDVYPNEQSAVIYSKWEIEKEIISTQSEVAALIRAPFGKIIVYATIISYHMSGVNDNGKFYKRNYKAWERHKEEIELSNKDWKYINSLYPDIPLLILGDFNQTRDGYKRGYGTEECRQLLSDKLFDNQLTCITEEDFSLTNKLSPDPKKNTTRRNIDHICVSNKWLENLDSYYIGAWDHFNEDGYYISDHNGVYMDFR